jgi:chorismate mutase / prephenate dehydratase
METLLAVRAELDAIDDALHDLLMRRAAVVARLADSRAKAGTPVLRPGREAAILRRLMQRHHGPMPRAVLLRIWRELLASSIRQQDGFTLALCGAGAAREAAAHFGLLTATREFAQPAAALAALAAGACSAAVLPFPDAADDWWCALETPRLSVVARLPVLATGHGDAVVVAPGAPDESGDDRSLLLVETQPGTAADALLRGLGQVGIAARVLLEHRAPALSRFLLEADGLLPAGDARLAASGFPRIRLLGGYATPITGYPT